MQGTEDGTESLEEELSKKAGSSPEVTFRFEVALHGEDSEPRMRALVRAAARSMASNVRSLIRLHGPDMVRPEVLAHEK